MFEFLSRLSVLSILSIQSVLSICILLSPDTYRFQYVRIIVVNGKAIISPMNPSREPHTDNDRSSMAGFIPIALPITLGVTIMSIIICTIANIATAEAKITQKFCPVSAAFIRARNAVGISAKVCRYGTRSSMPIRMPRPMAIGNPMIVNPMQKSMPIISATSDCPRT